MSPSRNPGTPRSVVGPRHAGLLALRIPVFAVIAAAAPAVLAAAAPSGALASGGTVSLAPPAGPMAADSSDAPAPAGEIEAIKLSAQGSFSLPAPRVGDSLDYTVAVEWEDTGIPVVVLAPDSAAFPGFAILGQAAQHRKTADGRTIRNHTEFTYRLRAKTQGPGKAISLKVRYLTGLSRDEEAVFVPAALVDIGPAPVRLLDRLWARILLWLLLFAAAAGAGWAAFRFTSRRRAMAPKGPERPDLRPEVEALKLRLRAADSNPDASKEILLGMEAAAIKFLQGNAYGSPNRSSNGDSQRSAGHSAVRFEPLLDSWLAAGSRKDSGEWEKLRELFRHARFAGGHKEPHELRDAFRTFRHCLELQAEDEP